MDNGKRVESLGYGTDREGYSFGIILNSEIALKPGMELSGVSPVLNPRRQERAQNI
jgi:hypothetical protein